mgnify:CR=1 FL=1
MSLMQYAKNRNVTIFIVGHVNKEGTLAGPKILEHMVDCVLYFEGESAGPFRCLRAAKNRYGSTNEIGVFEMSDHGLLEVQNPSAAMLAGHPQGASGNCIACVMEAAVLCLPRCRHLLRKRSLVCRAAPLPAWTTTAWCCCSPFWKNAAGCFCRRAMCTSTSSAACGWTSCCGFADGAGNRIQLRDKPLPEGVMSFGEVGLTGELRAVSNPGQRINEAYRLGFHTCIMPMQDVDEDLLQKMNIVRAKTVGDAIRAVL